MSTVVVFAVQRIPKLTANLLIFISLFISFFFWGGGAGVFGEEAAPSLTGSHIISLVPFTIHVSIVVCINVSYIKKERWPIRQLLEMAGY